jgi:hypothetical protein
VDLLAFLAALDERRVSYRMDRVRDAIMVIVATPGQRWEVEFMDGGTVEVERFRSDGTISDERAIDELLAELS